MSIDKILVGIDKTEIESEEGWWETSTGAAFGAAKLAELKQYLQENYMGYPSQDETHNILADYAKFVAARARMFPTHVEDLHHAATGCATEAGELLSTTKKLWVYRKEITDVEAINLDEEAGDLLYYIQHLCNLQGITILGLIERNMEKLRKRYPQGYSDAAAMERADKK